MRRNDIRLKDKQNFHAAERIFSLDVINELQRILPPSPRREALLFFLRIGFYFTSGFLDPTRHVVQRIFDVFAARFLLVAWREDLRTRAVNLREGFLSSNLVDCVLLNSDMLLAYTMRLLDYDHLRRSVPYTPWRLGSQDCENLFRDIRASLHCNENIVAQNMLSHLRNTDALNSISHMYRHNIGFGSTHDKAPRFDDRHKEASLIPDDVTPAQVLDAVKRAATWALAVIKNGNLNVKTDGIMAQLSVDNDDLADVDLTHVSCRVPFTAQQLSNMFDTVRARRLHTHTHTHTHNILTCTLSPPP